MKLEEKMLEMEERRQKDKQDFVMRMGSFMCNPSMPLPNTSHPPPTVSTLYIILLHTLSMIVTNLKTVC